MTDLALRIVVVRPPPDVLFCVQGKLGEYLQPTRSTGEDLVFDVSVRVAGPGPRLLGRVVQGPPAARFIYVCSGTGAGDASSCWSRRAKIPLASITDAMVGIPLVARISGRARDGGPACATVPLLDGGWEMLREQ